MTTLDVDFSQSTIDISIQTIPWLKNDPFAH